MDLGAVREVVGVLAALAIGYAISTFEALVLRAEMGRG